MCDKALKHLQSLQQLIKNFSKDEQQSQKQQIKQKHMIDTLQKIKKQIDQISLSHTKQLKQKTKSINKLKKHNIQITDKISHQINKNTSYKKNHKYWSYYNDNLDSDHLDQNYQHITYLHSKQIKNMSQSYLLINKQLKNQIQQLQNQNHNLKSQIQSLTILLNQCIKQQIYNEPCSHKSITSDQISDEEKVSMIAKKTQQKQYPSTIKQNLQENLSSEHQILKQYQEVQTQDQYQYQYQIEVYLSKQASQNMIPLKTKNCNNQQLNSNADKIQEKSQINSQQTIQIQVSESISQHQSGTEIQQPQSQKSSVTDQQESNIPEPKTTSQKQNTQNPIPPSPKFPTKHQKFPPQQKKQREKLKQEHHTKSQNSHPPPPTNPNLSQPFPSTTTWWAQLLKIWHKL